MKRSTRKSVFFFHYCTLGCIVAILVGILLCTGCILENPGPGQTIHFTGNGPEEPHRENTGTTPDITDRVTISPQNPAAKQIQTISFSDSFGQTLVLNESPKRIVCLNGDSARILVAIGAGDTVVGVLESTTKDTALMKKLPYAVSIGGAYNQPNIEQVISLKPDLVIALTSASPSLMGKLTEANVTVVYLDGYVIEKMPQFVESISAIGGSPSLADRS